MKNLKRVSKILLSKKKTVNDNSSNNGVSEELKKIKKHLKLKPEPIELDSIKLSDIKGEFRKDIVQKKLAENKDLLNLFAVKKLIMSKSGEQYVLVRLRFWNSEKRNYENPDLCSFISKSISDDLNAKFAGSSTWTVREAVL